MCQAAATGTTCWGNYRDDIDIEVGKERALAIPEKLIQVCSSRISINRPKKSALSLKVRLLFSIYGGF